MQWVVFVQCGDTPGLYSVVEVRFVLFVLKGSAMEVPGLLRRMAVTPVSMLVGPTISLRQPHTSEGMWPGSEIFSAWGSPVHQKCSTIPGDGSEGPVTAVRRPELADGDDGGIHSPILPRGCGGTRDVLGLGQSRPPEVLYHAEKWERGLMTAASWVSLSEGCGGGIPIWCVGFESALFRLFGLAGKVYAGLPLYGGANREMASRMDAGNLSSPDAGGDGRDS